MDSSITKQEFLMGVQTAYLATVMMKKGPLLEWGTIAGDAAMVMHDAIRCYDQIPENMNMVEAIGIMIRVYDPNEPKNRSDYPWMCFTPPPQSTYEQFKIIIRRRFCKRKHDAIFKNFNL